MVNNVDRVTFTEAAETDLNAMLALYNYHIVNTTATFDYETIDLKEFRFPARILPISNCLKSSGIHSARTTGKLLSSLAENRIFSIFKKALNSGISTAEY